MVDTATPDPGIGAPGPGALQLGPDSPDEDDVRALLEVHLALMRASSCPEDVHALDAEGLRGTRLVSARQDGRLLAVGALRPVGPGHLELKSMHTAEHARGRGIARLLLRHLTEVARADGGTRMSLETGTQPVFAAATALYLSEGFTVCAPFGTYVPSPASAFFTRTL